MKKKEELLREAADKVWELSKAYSYDREIMNIIRNCASELHLEAQKKSSREGFALESLHLVKDKGES